MASDSLQIISRLLVARLVNEVRGCLKVTLADYQNVAVDDEYNHRISNYVNPNILTASCSIGEIVLILSICHCNGLTHNRRFLSILLNTVQLYVLAFSSFFMEFVTPIFTIRSGSSTTSSSLSVAQLSDLVLQCSYVGLILYDLRSHLTTHFRPSLTETEPSFIEKPKPSIRKTMTDSNENDIIEDCSKKCPSLMIRREDSKTTEYDDALTENEVKQFYLGIPCIKTDKNPQPENLAFDRTLEISNIQLTLVKKHSSQVTGFYGTLVQGLLRRTNVKLKLEVGIKRNKPELGKEEFKRFLTELKIMHFVGRHDNILGVVGACTQFIGDGSLVIVTESCRNGTMNQYLKIIKDRADECPRKSLKGALKADQYRWIYEIVTGLNFLHSKRIIHGSLSTKTILLNCTKTAKITEFGTAPYLNQTDETETRRDTKDFNNSWRNLSYESLTCRTFTEKSDIWSFGMTSWEILTLCQVPFKEFKSFTEDFLQSVKTGLRPQFPDFLEEEYKKTQQACLILEPEARPTVKELMCFAFKKTLPKRRKITLNSFSEAF